MRIYSERVSRLHFKLADKEKQITSVNNFWLGYHSSSECNYVCFFIFFLFLLLHHFHKIPLLFRNSLECNEKVSSK